jgi:hypothetical protein
MKKTLWEAADKLRAHIDAAETPSAKDVNTALRTAD